MVIPVVKVWCVIVSNTVMTPREIYIKQSEIEALDFARERLPQAKDHDPRKFSVMKTSIKSAGVEYTAFDVHVKGELVLTIAVVPAVVDPPGELYANFR